MSPFKKLFFIILLFCVNSNLSYASSINDIQVIDENNINFELSKDVDLSGSNINGEFKIMKDIEISIVSKDFEDKNKLILNLGQDLEENSIYSLISILGPNGNMDFQTGIGLEEKEFSNLKNLNTQEQSINRLYIKNSRTIELYFNNIIEETEIEYKLFNEKRISKIELIENTNKVNINLLDNLNIKSNYILMILSLQDSFGNNIVLDEDLFDINIRNELKKSVQYDNEEIIEEELVEIDEGIIDDGTVEGVALNAAETPDTGPETTVLIFLTITLNTIFIFRKKILKK